MIHDALRNVGTTNMTIEEALDSPPRVINGGRLRQFSSEDFGVRVCVGGACDCHSVS